MADMVIPNYETVLVPNSTWCRKGKMATNIENKRINTLEVLQVRRYTEPTTEEVIAYISKRARQIDMAAVKAGAYIIGQKENAVDAFLREMPLKELERLRDGNKDAIKHLEAHVGHEKLKGGVSYLEVLGGVISEGLLHDQKDEIAECGADFFRAAIGALGKDTWTVKMRYDVAVFGDEIRNLMRHKVKDSDSLMVEGSCYEKLERKVNDVCAVLSRTGDSGKLEDLSAQHLAMRAAISAGSTAECVKRRMLVGGLLTAILSGKLDELIEESGDGKNKGLDIYGHTSPN